MPMTISQGTDVSTIDYALNGYACIADLAGYTFDITNPGAIFTDGKLATFFACVFGGIGNLPLGGSDAAINALPAAVQPIVRRAHAIQQIRANNGEDLTPCIALNIAEANDQAGADNWQEAPEPLGTPVGSTVSAKYWTVQTPAAAANP